MRITVLIIISIIALLPAFFGIMIRLKKAYWLISDYNTMSEEEQLNVDKEKMGKAASNTLFIITALMTAGVLSLYFYKDTMGIIAFLLILPTALISVALSQKYDHNKRDSNEGKFIVAGLGFFFTLVIILVFTAITSGSKPVNFTVDKGVLSISGNYGKDIDLSGVKNIELKDSMPVHLYKTNGFNFNTVLKGHFRSGDENLMLYVDTSKPPFIYMDTSDGMLILNCKNAGETQQLYETLKARLQK